MRKAFTMMELVFVIVVIGILSAIAIPKFSATRDDAKVSKARATVAALRNAVATERQKRILRGYFTDISSLGGSTGNGVTLFDYFDGTTSGNRVLEYPIRSCAGSGSTGCWVKTSDTTYDYKMPGTGTTVTFTLSNNRFDCTHTDTNCRKLTE